MNLSTIIKILYMSIGFGGLFLVFVCIWIYSNNIGDDRLPFIVGLVGILNLVIGFVIYLLAKYVKKG